MNRDELKKSLSCLPHQHVCWFASRCALRVVSDIAYKGEKFPFWNETKLLFREGSATPYLFAIFRAVNAALLMSMPGEAPIYASSGSASAADAAAKAANFLDTRVAAIAYLASYAADAAANTEAKSADSAAATAYVCSATTDYALKDLNYLNKPLENLSWLDLWHGQPPRQWRELTYNLLKGLRFLGLDYWADEYRGWVEGRFNAEKMSRCLMLPEATIKAGPEAMLLYFNVKELVRMAEARVVFLGEGEAGKTSLIRCLHGEEIRREEQATPRVEIRSRLEQIGEDEIHVHCWDFGGQVIMHATHQFFLREKSVYVVVLDIRRCDSLEYWLDHVRVFAPGAPTLIVLNKVDSLYTGMETRPPFDINKIRRRYSFVSDVVYPMSCTTTTGVEAFAAALKYHISENLVLRKDMPKQWFKIKESLVEQNKDFISRDKFNDICRFQGVDGNEISIALKVLDILGVAIHFPNIRHSDVVLNPEWITKAIYFIISSSEKRKLEGMLNVTSLQLLFDEGRKNEELDVNVPNEKCGFLLDLMDEFKLAFKNKSRQGTYCVPMLAPTMEPDHGVKSNGGSRFVFSLPFLPPGLFYRFVAESGHEVVDDMIWKSGVILSRGEIKVLVEYSDYQRNITFNAHGPRSGVYLTTLRQRLMQLLGESYKDLDYDTYIITADGERINWRDLSVRYSVEGDSAKVYTGLSEHQAVEILKEFFGVLEADLKRMLQNEFDLMRRYTMADRQFKIEVNPIISPTISPSFDQKLDNEINTIVSVSNELQSLLRVDSDLKVVEEILNDFIEDHMEKASKYENELKQLQREIYRLRLDIAELEAIPENIPTAEAKKMPILERIKGRWDKIADLSKQFYYVIGFSEKISKIGDWINRIDWSQWQF